MPMTYRESMESMGTFLSVASSEKIPDRAVQAVRQVFQRTEIQCSRFLPFSELSAVNRSAGCCPVSVSGEFLEVLKESLRMARRTGGVFDPTAGALSGLWRVGHTNAGVPSAAEQEKAAGLVDYKKVQIRRHRVFLQVRGMQLDLGGIAKEYALHRAAEAAESAGLRTGLIDAGGDICTVGTKRDGQAWKIGIQHPRKKGRLLAAVDMKEWDTAETSGDYRRFFFQDGIFQSHIFSVGARPSVSAVSATLIYRRKSGSIPLAASFLIAAGLDRAIQFLSGLPDMEAVLASDDGRVFLTEGLKGSIRFFTGRRDPDPEVIYKRVV